MKLQIISKLTKNQNHYKPYSLQTSSIQQPYLKYSKQENFHEYYSTSLQSQRSKQAIDQNIRQFFNNFSSNCTAIYQSLSQTNHRKKVKRNLFSQLQALRTLQQINNNDLQISFCKKQPKISVNKVQSTSKNCLKTQQRINSYYINDKVHQKIRKINSLITLNSNNQSSQQARKNNTRKPGFIKRINSLSKNQPINNKKNHSRELNIDVNEPKRVKQSKITGDILNRVNSHQSIESIDRYNDQMRESKDRIAKIRRQLNGIYQMKSKHSFKLKLN